VKCTTSALTEKWGQIIGTIKSEAEHIQ